MQSFKHDLQKVFKQTAGLKTDMLKNTSDISDNMTGYYDLVIVDEAHRLKHKKNMGMTIGQFYKNCKRHGLDKILLISLILLWQCQNIVCCFMIRDSL